MWALGAWLLLGAVGSGSAQLLLRGNKTVEHSICNETVILPCTVINLQLKNIEVMFVKWKLEKKEFFSFEGRTKQRHTNSSFSTARLVSIQNLIHGDASLLILKQQAVSGNYSCEVTESNREGEIVTELIYRPETWFTRTENTLIILVLLLAILLYWSQFFILLKYKITFLKKICLIVGGLVILIFVIIGSILLVSDGYAPKNQAGFGLIVIPAVILVPLQYFVLQIVLENKWSLFAISVVILKSVGYLVAVIGFALCVGACPPKSGVVVIVGLAIMAVVEAFGLIYLIDRVLLGCNKKNHQLPRKAVEEPLNDAKGVMLE